MTCPSRLAIALARVRAGISKRIAAVTDGLSRSYSHHLWIRTGQKRQLQLFLRSSQIHTSSVDKTTMPMGSIIPDAGALVGAVTSSPSGLVSSVASSVASLTLHDQNLTAALSITDFRFELSAPLSALLSIHPSNLHVARLAAALVPAINAVVPDRHAKLAILNGLSHALLDPCLNEDILRLFRPLVIDLVARLVNKTPEPETPSYSPDASKPGKRRRTQDVEGESLVPDDESSMDIDTPVLSPHDLTTHELTCIVLGKLVLVAPQIKPLIVYYFASQPSPVDRLIRLSTTSPLSPVAGAQVLTATYRLLTTPALTQQLAHRWDLFPLRAIALDPATPAAVRVPAAHVVAESLRLMDADRTRFLATSCKDVPESQYKMFALEQSAHVQQLQRALGADIPQAHGEAWVVTASHLSSNVVDVCGLLLTTSPAPVSASETGTASGTSSDLIETHTTRRNLFSISLALSLGAPVLLQGVTGSGKTALIDSLASRLHARVTKIHLGDQSDAKSLLGTYVATSTPGQFKWSRGVLTRAVEDGHWLVLEDMDLASKDVISVLVPLLEKRKVYVAQRGQEVRAHPGFQLFATMAVDPYTGAPRAGAAQGLGAGLWTHVQVKALPRDELAHVLMRRFPRLARLAPVMLDAFERVAAVYHDPANRSSYKSGGRYMSTRDLIKWCKRADRYVRPGDVLEYASVTKDENVTEPLMREALDVFVCMIPSTELRKKVVEVLGEALDVGEVKRGWLVDKYAPNIVHLPDESKFVAGRAALTITRTASLRSTGHSHPFATTAHAKRLLERIAVAVDFAEPILLVGETGTGKTTVVQHLARVLNTRLHVINLSQQTESSDLMGGFKPANVAAMVAPLIEEFYPLFGATFSIKKNAKFLDLVKRAQVKSKYEGLVTLLAQACKMAADRFDKHDAAATAQGADAIKAEAKAPSKKVAADPTLRAEWKDFAMRVDEVKGMVSAANKLFFSFVEGTLVSAIRKGEWVLLDEVNLASGETLESLSGLLEEHGSLLLTERGDEQVVPRHAEFRLFACMNPATDVGKRDLPIGLRNRFSEVYVESPDAYLEDLTLIVKSYLDGVAHADPSVVDHVVQLYLEAKKLAESVLYDGAGTRPHFSLRTLSRALSFASTVAPMYGVRRALYEGFAMTFVTLLDVASQTTLEAVMDSVLCAGKAKHMIAKSTPAPANTDAYVQFGSYWLPRGPYEPPEAEQAKRAAYVMTPSVQRNLGNLARAVMTVRYPVLIQGPTSSGKTSMIEHLAHVTHHKFVRINNHEHTDLQEYLGCYVSDDQGKLVFKEGALVTALKEGHWIVLDELNLAPTDVLEALNRLLDDNRELFIPETQQVVRPHPHFMLFATQNPPSYGGRKVLSRAFRNRFLELHFDDLPDEELHTILAGRCKIAPSYAKAIISVYQELRRRRQESRLFDGKSSFITLRDLFRWANRPATNYQTLAENGWMILGERVRSHAERHLVVQVLQGMKKGIVIEPQSLYERIFAEFKDRIAQIEHLSASIVWNKTMKRLFSLVVSCIANQEPILLVGETGCGKTTVCQVIAELEARQLVIVNCHQHSETSDFIGSQRPAREQHHQQQDDQHTVDLDHRDESTDSNTKLFEWQDGPLVQAMKQGHFFLLDEVSLADDSVLERLNSVLEPSRTLLIAEKGGDVEQVTAVESFRFLATMNPGGDYGKKELSPALRNRFTEIWTDQVEDYHDLHEIVAAKLKGDTETATAILDFVTWFKEACRQDHVGVVISMRDLIAWSEFVMASRETLGTAKAYLHGGCMVLLDGIKSTSFAAKCLAELEAKAGTRFQAMSQVVAEGVFGIGAFTIPLGAHPVSAARHTLNAPTSRENLLRVLRALQIPSKAILLEGSPGVGKTSLVSALSHLSGHKLVRINLSEQTDLIDLFGSDLPVEGGQAGEFAWRDGPFLSAMKAGDWVLLDELNLASQSVLEGLNACLDHRGSVYLPELDRSFDKHPDFRIFGAQNPLEEGGGRRGLPKSFLNRFTQVHVRALTDEDLMIIVNDMYPNATASSSVVQQMLEFNSQLHHKTMVSREFGMAGSPWEFNLRDVLRWLELMEKTGVSDPATFLDVLYLQRMQTDSDRVKTLQLWNQVTGSHVVSGNPTLQVTSTGVELGLAQISRLTTQGPLEEVPAHVLVPHTMLRPLQALLTSIQAGWMTMVVGPSGCGKTALVRTAAALTGHPLIEFAMNSSVDALELLGGFEQVDRNRCLEQLTRALSTRSSALLAYFSHDCSSLETDALVQLAAYQRISVTQLSEDQLQHWIDLIAYASDAAADSGSTSPAAERESHMHMLAKYKQLSSTAGKFEWVDGVLLDAVQNGKWLLLDNANLCSPSVLDRLNPLFEASLHRHLLINERGQTQDGKFVMVEPHPNFRMFMTLDPKFGQISRAMRNRGIEVALVDSQWMHDPYLLTQLLEVKGVQDPDLRTAMLSRFTRHASREFVMAVDHTLDLLQRGFRASHAVTFVAHHSQVHHLHDHAPEHVPAQLVPHPPLLLQHSESSLIHAKTSFLSSPLTPVDHLEVAMDCLVEQPDLARWKQWLSIWINWCRHSPLTMPGPRVDTDRFLLLVDRMSGHISQLPSGHHVLVRCVLQYTKLKLAQEQVFSQTSALKLSKMNMIQRSHCAHAFPHRLSSVEASPTVTALYPILIALESGVISAVASFEDAMLHVLLWSWSLWNQCLVASELNLDLLDAHVSQLLEATKGSAAFSGLHIQLRQLQLTYAGDMEASQAVWLCLHPWAVRTADLFEPVMDLLSFDRDCLPADLCRLTVDALTNVFLGDASQQALLLDDLPRLLQLIAPFRAKAVAVEAAATVLPASEEDCNNLLVLGGGDEDDLESVRSLVSQGEQTEAARSAALQKWVWSASIVQVLAHAAHRTNTDLPPTCAKFSESHAPSLAELVHFRLLQWSLDNASAVARSWNMVYVDVRRVLHEQPLWQPRPTLLSSELVAACDHASVIDMDATIQRLKSTAGLLLDHQDLLQLDLVLLERDLLSARIQLLQGMPMRQSATSRLEQSQVLVGASGASLADIGLAWVQLGLAFMEAAIPTSPLDPATRFSLVHHYTKKLESTLQLELQVRIALQLRNNGMDTNPTIDWLRTRLAAVRKEVQETSRQLYLRPANANEQLKQLFGEFRSLLSSLTNDQSFLTQLVQGSIASVQCSDSIAVVQRTLNMFVSRTSANYPLFMDLLEPVYSGIHDVLHGLRLVDMSHSEDPAELVQLAALPAIRPSSLQSLIDFACSPDNDHGTSHAVALLEAIATHRELTGFAPNIEHTVLPLVDVLLERFQQKCDEDNRRRKEQDATFKYATKSHVIEDEEIDWFKLDDDPFTEGLKRESGLNGEAAEDEARNDPSMYLDQVNKLDAGNSDPKAIKQRERQASERFSALVYRAFEVYQELFGDWSSAHRLETIPAQDHCAPGSSGLTHIVAMLANHKRMTDPVDEAKYDFYRHANLKEVAHLKDILVKLDLRVKSLLDQWPDHAVLQQLVTIAHRLAEFPAAMPLIKFVQSLEYLLEKCDEWEKFAAKHVSIREHMDAISALIIDWRRLELFNWANLLDYFDAQEKKEGSPWWLHLYSVLVYASGINSQDLVSSLDEFIMSSTVGQLELRLEILAALNRHFKVEVLANTHDYYAQFVPHVKQHISKQRVEIEKELKDQFKIASWKDVNVYALKQSAQRTHRQLNKCLRKYRLVLQEPLLSLIGQKSDGLFADQVTPTVHRPSVKLSQALHFYPDAVSKQLSVNPDWAASRDTKLGVILSKSRQLSSLVGPMPLPLVDFTQELIEGIRAFKKETDSITEKLAKHEATTMLQIRKKALSDLLKQFREMGLSWRHAAVPTTADMMLMPTAVSSIESELTFYPLTEAAKSYHLRMVALMQSMPEMMGQRSEDIQVNQAERALGYATDFFKLVTTERRHLTPALNELVQLTTLANHLETMTNASSVPTAFAHLDTVSSELLTQSSLAIMCQRVTSLNILSSKPKTAVEDLCATVLGFIRRFRAAYPDSKVELHDAELLREWITAKETVRQDFLELARECPRDAIILRGIVEYLEPQSSDVGMDDAVTVDEIVSAGQQVIEAIMVQLQSLYQFNSHLASLADDVTNTDARTPDLKVKSIHASIVELLSKLSSSTSVAHLVATSPLTRPWRCLSHNQSLVWHQVKRISPLITNLAAAMHSTLFNVAQHHKTLAKAGYVVLINMTKLVRQGFCVPQTSDGDDDDAAGGQGDGQFEEADGTGIGQGSGNKDVSDEIEDEEQVLGLKDEDDQADESGDQERKENKKDEGMEMENDFDGDLEDLNLDGDEKQDQMPESADEEEEGDDPDEAMDQVDNPEDHKVDESLWQDDEEQELREADDLENEKVNRDTHDVEDVNEDQKEAPEQQQLDQEDVDMNYEGHMDEDQDSPDTDDKPPKDQQAQQQPKDIDQAESGEQQDEQDEHDDDMLAEGELDGAESDDEDASDPMDVDAEDDATAEGAQEEEEQEAAEGQEAKDEDKAMCPEEEVSPEDESREVDMGMDESYDQQDEPDSDGADDPEDAADPMNVDQPDEMPPQDQEAAGVPEVSAADAIQEEEEQEKDAVDQSEDKMTKVGLSNRDDGQDDAAERTEDMAQRGGQTEQEHADSNATAQDQQDPSSGREEEQRKSLGDAIREWRERLNMVERQQQQQQPESQGQEDDKANYDQHEYEYVQEDDTEPSNEQTLGAAEKDQQMALPPMPEDEEEKDEAGDQDESNSDDIDRQIQPDQTAGAMNQRDTDTSRDRNSDDMDTDETPHQVQPDAGAANRFDDEDELTEEAEAEMRAEIAQDLAHHRRQPGQPAPELWHKYKAVTHHLALQLTEQLRLILEPTQAAKLTGDYKTGKRLNMKKIIPYIASDFKKDKIWLRRTKPSKRTYNVMLAVDDSESMADSQSVTLAFEAMAVLARAMSQLEVGQLAVAAFGEQVELVHPFERPFSDDAGAQALGQFTFAQQRTKVVKLLESAIQAFDEASLAASGAGEAWHLLLVLSDGVCEDHDKIRNLVRRAAERRVLVAFLVLDQKPEAESIMKMTSVAFEGGKVVMRRYMETFPFDFYIVLRDVSRLPVVLSDALRQFFAIASQS